MVGKYSHIAFDNSLLFKRVVGNRITKILEVIFRVERGRFVIDDLMEGEKLEQGSTKNEIDRIFRHLKKMVDTLQPVIYSVITKSKDVAFESSFGFVKGREALDLADKQMRWVSVSNEHINSILDLNSSLNASLQDIFDKSYDSLSRIKEGQKLIKVNIETSQKASNEMDNTVKSINQLKIFSDEISQTIEKITDIADETNL